MPMLEFLTFRRLLLVLTVQLTTLLQGMSITVISVVLPQMKGTLSATQDQIAWTVTFNLVATAIATPMTGWLAARLGWRNLLVGTVVGFTIATVLCGTADSLEALVFYRILQGVFGAPLQPLGQGMLLASFPKHLHAMVLMMWGIGGVFGPVLGPVFVRLTTGRPCSSNSTIRTCNGEESENACPANSCDSFSSIFICDE